MAVFVEAPARTPVDAEVRDAVLATARLCQTLGHTVDPIPCPFDGGVTDDFLRYWGFFAWAQVRTARLALHWHFDRSKLEPWSRGIAATFARAKLRTIAAIWRLRRFSRAFATVTDRYDVLVFPTLAEPAPPLGALAGDRPFAATFERVRSYAAAFTPLANVAGAPAISLPMGRTATGLPIGVQFAAAHGRDRMLLDLALALEAAQPWEATAPRERWLSSRVTSEPGGMGDAGGAIAGTAVAVRGAEFTEPPEALPSRKAGRPQKRSRWRRRRLGWRADPRGGGGGSRACRG
jgi:amidase